MLKRIALFSLLSCTSAMIFANVETLKNNLNQISSFCTDNSNCTVVSGKELKDNISEYLYEKEIY